MLIAEKAPEIRVDRVAPSTTVTVPTVERITLLGLPINTSGVVCGLGISQAAAKRLADMGFVRGARIEMVRPGSPCIVRLNGIFVGLGQGHQKSILVSPMEPPPSPPAGPPEGLR